MDELRVKIRKPTVLYYDNISVIYLTNNLVFHERTKHIKIDCHFKARY